MIPWIEHSLTSFGLSETLASGLAPWIAGVVVACVAILSNLIAKRLLLRAVQKLVQKSRFQWDDQLVKRRVFGRLSHLAPGLVIYAAAGPIWGERAPEFASLLMTAATLYMLLVGVLVLDSFLNAIGDIAMKAESSKHVPVRGFIQVIKLLLYVACILSVIALVVGRSPLEILAGLGAMTAVLMLVFKDPILGLVAGVQLSGNRMLSRGDWIEMPKHGADGEILEVALTTVKVRNWDNTITTIPTYSFISDSFKNWQGMTESGGRRIKRSISIDVHTIRFCDEAMLERYSKIQFIAEYLERKKEEITEHNQGLAGRVDLAMLANGRRLTNVGTFRAYIEAYLRNHPLVSQDLTLLVRQLAPSETGLPIEIYVFCTDKRWVHYEAVASDIFDHILAVVPEFDLKVFQYPSGFDLLRKTED